MSLRSNEKGFTLIELLIVIAIIGFIAAAVLVAVDPVRRIQDSRDTQRWSETNAILNAILNWQVDNVQAYDGVGTSTFQTYTVTLTGVAGDAAVEIEGIEESVPFDTDLTTTAADLAAAIEATTTYGTVDVSATSAGAVVTIVGDDAGVPFTVEDTSSGGMTGTVAETIEALVGSGIDSSQNTIQVIVSDAIGIDCDTPATAPACPDGLAYGTLSTSAGVGCVANLSDLSPDYLAEVPTDPITGVPTESPDNLAIGTTNTGYFINKVGNGNNKRLSVGSCYGEQTDTIYIQR
jgi:prepilin-type N-terminal cleavage/methylation domain-containing protein